MGSALLDRMRPEIPAITNWFLEGLRRLIKNGFKFSHSEAVEEALKEYRSKLDTVYRFITEGAVIPPAVVGYCDGEIWHYVITKNRADQVSKRDFYSTYEQWCKDPEIDVIPVRQKNLAQRLESLGLEIDRKGTVGNRKGIYTIRGLKLINDITGDSRIPTQAEVEEYRNKLRTKCPPECPPEWEPVTESETPWRKKDK